MTQIVDRTDEKEKLKTFFQQRKSKRKIIEITGMYGIGKSEMLKWTYNKYQNSDVVCAFYNFESSIPEQVQFLHMLRDIAKKTNEQQSSHHLSTFLTLYDHADKDPHITDMDIKTLSAAFNQGLSKDLQCRSMFMFFDTTEEAHPKTIDILNNDILPRHIEHSNIKFAFSGEKPVVWLSEDIRKSRMNLFLNTFNNHDMNELIEQIVAENAQLQVSQNCIAFCRYIAGGNPGILKESFDYLSRNMSAQWDKSVCKELVSHLFQIFMQDNIISKFRIDDESIPLEELITQIAMLRKIDLHPFKMIIADNFQKPFSEKSAMYYDYLLNRIFSHTYLFKKIEHSPGYRLNKCFYRINQRNLFFNNRQKFDLIQQRIQNYYYERIPKFSGTDQINAICEYFFTTHFMPHKSPASLSIKTDLLADLNAIIEKTCPKGSDFDRESHELRINKAIQDDEDVNI